MVKMAYYHYVFSHTLTILNNLDKEKARLTGRTSTFLTEKKKYFKTIKLLTISYSPLLLAWSLSCIYCSPSRSILFGDVSEANGRETRIFTWTT